MITCAASKRAGRLSGRSGDTATPYARWRIATTRPFATALTIPPPPAITPITAIWVAPVKTRADNATAFAVETPAAVARAPNERPYTPVATPMATALPATLSDAWICGLLRTM